MLRIHFFGLFCLWLAVAVASTRLAHAYDVSGPVLAEVVRVVDGDTVEVRAHPWPQNSVLVKVRLRGIDAPEIHTRCKEEKALGEAARAALQSLLYESGEVWLTDITGGKYFGRVLANIQLAEGGDAANTLLKAGLVRQYSGGKRSRPTCS